MLDELPRPDRTWWAAFEVADTRKRTVNVGEAKLVGYAGGWINDGQVQLLKVASDPAYRRQGIAQELLARIALDARDLGAKEMALEVRASNTGAHAFYERLGFKLDNQVYHQPPYREGGEWLEMRLMTYGDVDLEHSFELVKNCLHKNVYGVKDGLTR